MSAQSPVPQGRVRFRPSGLLALPLHKRIGLLSAVVVLSLAGIYFLRPSQAVTNPSLKGDLNNDNIVNLTDLSILLSSFGKTSADSDLNGDGQVNLTDLSILLSNFGKTVTPPGPTPTPPPTPNPNPNPTPNPPPTGNTVNVSSATELKAALAGAKAGDVIKMADGTYGGQFVSTKSGTAAAPITLFGSRKAVINGGSLGSGYALSLGAKNTTSSISYWKMIGFTVTGGQKGIVWDNVQHSTIDGVLVQNIGQEGIHLRDFSSDNVIQNSTVTKTGQDEQQYGEGMYVGSAQSNWKTYSQGKPDLSNNNQILNSSISFTGAENIDIKEGTHKGVIKGNTFDGSGMCFDASKGCNFADSLIDMKGEGWAVANNTGSHVRVTWNTSGVESDGFQVHVISQAAADGSGNNNTFTGNKLSDITGYGFNIQSKATGVKITCDNTVSNAGKGFGNVSCQ